MEPDEEQIDHNGQEIGVAASEPEVDDDVNDEAADVYRTFLRTGQIKAGWAINVMWPEKARKIGED